MSQLTGFVSAALQLGVQAILIKPKRSIGPLVAQVTIQEVHQDTLEITDHPVEMGAVISDHAFKRPAELIITCAWSNSPGGNGSNPLLSAGLAAGILGLQGANSATVLTGAVGGGLGGAIDQTGAGVQALLTGNSPGQVKAIYQKLLKLQEDRIPFDVTTGKRSYKNMLVRSLQVTTDKTSENSLQVVATLRQVILVSTKPLTQSAPPEAQRFAGTTNPVTNFGTKVLGPAVADAKAAILQGVRATASFIGVNQ
jgi:hypothetical protein